MKVFGVIVLVVAMGVGSMILYSNMRADERSRKARAAELATLLETRRTAYLTCMDQVKKNLDWYLNHSGTNWPTGAGRPSAADCEKEKEAYNRALALQ
jgi:hypothetical protein